MLRLLIACSHLFVFIYLFSFFFFFEGYAAHRDLHKLTHSFPTRRSSDLRRSPDRRDRRGDQRRRRPIPRHPRADRRRSEEHTSELQSRELISYAVFCLKKKKTRMNTIDCSMQSKRKTGR